MAIIDLVTRVDDTDPVDLEPLYNAIDPDALDAVCGSNLSFQRLEFPYEGYTVTVESSGAALEITLDDAAASRDDVTGPADTESSP